MLPRDNRLLRHTCSPNYLLKFLKNFCSETLFNPFPTTILDTFKLKEFADDNLKFDENGRKFSEWVENTVGK